jgi:alpha-1,4-digalacturonate transport system permease protein
MSTILEFLTRKRGRKKLDLSDLLSYFYLLLGVLIMFGPVVWLILSSFKSPIEISRFPPRFFPFSQQTVVLEGYDEAFTAI